MICPACRTRNRDTAETCSTCGRTLTLLPAGSLLASRYEILSQLGRGGMGVVYQARDQVLDDVVAIKVLRPEVGSADEMAQRFRSEIKLARKVTHPSVCRIHDYGEDGGLLYISMAFLEGQDLRGQIRDAHPAGLPAEEAFDVAIQLAEGLEAIHAAGIIHRDLKTGNVMRSPDGRVQLMDFGIAKDSRRTTGGLTKMGALMGTPEYMSPEQCQGATLDFRTDIYALGVVLFEVFTGEVPFKGDTLVATLFKHIREEPPLTVPPGDRLPAAMVPVLRKALAKRPDERYASAAEMAEALREACAADAEEARRGAQAPAAPSEPPPERRSHSRLNIYLDVVLTRLDEAGEVIARERSVAENVSRGGLLVLTAMTSIRVGEVLELEEVGGDLRTRARVRHAYTGEDRIYRLGLDLLDGEVPDRLLPMDYTPTSLREPRPLVTAQTAGGATPTVSTPGASGSGAERRRHSRLEIHPDLMLKRLDPSGAVVQEERTVAENLSRGGARVLTSMEVSVGDVVILEEVGTRFETRAAVRNKAVGGDGIPRLGLQFLDRDAPDYLVPTDEN